MDPVWVSIFLSAEDVLKRRRRRIQVGLIVVVLVVLFAVAFTLGRFSWR